MPDSWRANFRRCTARLPRHARRAYPGLARQRVRKKTCEPGRPMTALSTTAASLPRPDGGASSARGGALHRPHPDGVGLGKNHRRYRRRMARGGPPLGYGVSGHRLPRALEGPGKRKDGLTPSFGFPPLFHDLSLCESRCVLTRARDHTMSSCAIRRAPLWSIKGPSAGLNPFARARDTNAPRPGGAGRPSACFSTRRLPLSSLGVSKTQSSRLAAPKSEAH